MARIIPAIEWKIGDTITPSIIAIALKAIPTASSPASSLSTIQPPALHGTAAVITLSGPYSVQIPKVLIADALTYRR
jgi:hypothetical protein